MLIEMNPYDIVAAYERSKTIPDGVAVLVDGGIDRDVAHILIRTIDAAVDKWEVDVPKTAALHSPKEFNIEEKSN